MVVDLGRCLRQGRRGCSFCVDACHDRHNVPDFVRNPRLADHPLRGNNPRHEVKWIWRAPFRNAFPDEWSPEEGERGELPVYFHGELATLGVPVLCNHCDNPPCVRVCPTRATWRRDDGIVMMDMHRCIGCRLCVAACPYGARSFNFRDPRQAFTEPGTDRVVLPSPGYPTRMRGVVEKCTFCSELVGAEDRAPHCVRACSAGALTFGDLSDEGSAVRDILRSSFTIRRRPSLGTRPHVFYVVSGLETATRGEG
jgi:Fe-S-cluster-containing dehydrogenase component